MELMRWCPSCESERALDEHFCMGTTPTGNSCGWVLSGEPIHPRGWRPAPVVTHDQVGAKAPDETAESTVEQTVVCFNGHPMEADDLICMICDSLPAEQARDAAADPLHPQPETIIEGWRLLSHIAETPGVRERYRAVHQDSGREAVLTLYHAGAEPDPDVYAVLARLPQDYVPELIVNGRWNDRAFEVMEALEGTLASLGLQANDSHAIGHVLGELGPILHAFAEAGLRHRDLRPATILLRSREPLDLVIGGFGSAQLSAFDLDLVPPLETSRYMAPEAVAGGVAAASDWWSLGMLLLEQITAGACFEGIHPSAWLIHVMTHGVPLPADLPPDINLLLRGLLAHDHHQRWQWREVQAWLAGESLPAPPAARQASDEMEGEGIELGGRRWRNPQRFALEAGSAQHWDEAREHLRRGVLLGWVERMALDAQIVVGLRNLTRHESLDDDQRLMLALLWFNPDMPLILRGEIASPGWLLEHPQQGWSLLSGEAPDLLARRQPDHWLPRMKARAERIRERARQRGIGLDEAQFQVLALSSARARLAAQWQARQALLPDSPHAGIQSLVDRPQLGEEELILLLAADIGQFQATDSLLNEAAQRARRIGIESFQREAAEAWVTQGRRAIWQALDARLQGFAACGIEMADQLAGQYRLQRRLPLVDALALLAVPQSQWVEPRKQQYLAQLLAFFEKKVVASAMRGPLVRMSVARNSARIDLTELGSDRRPATGLLDAILQRSGQLQTLDPAVFTGVPLLQHRLNTLERNRHLHERDTGIDGLYVGFPFLLHRDQRSHVRTRIAPILLWPAKLELPVGRRAQARLGFDAGREEVRLNPALEGMLGNEARERWQKVADDLLKRGTLTTSDVMDAFAMLAPIREGASGLVALPPLDTELAPGQQRLAAAAVLFHATFSGQAVGEELRQMRQRSPAGTGLEALLRLRDLDSAALGCRPAEVQRFLTASSDPSQEDAVLQAANAPGLVIEGPPGTGKSQTIVNMVADAIGRGRSLLLVCQKPAALEVVHKRLIAEGLGDRVVMLNDVNRDREHTIRAIREQVDALHRNPSPADDRRGREQLAARIEELEGELDRHYQALHRVDEDCGLSWRQIVGELMALEAEGTPPEFPALRLHLANLDVTALARREEHCAPLIRWWLPARYEGSALANLKPVATDNASCEALAQAFLAFSEAEIARDETLAAHPTSFDIEDPEPHRRWLTEHAAALRALHPSQCQRLARWLPLFRGERTGEALIQQLRGLTEQLLALDHTAWQSQLSPALSALPASRLNDLQAQAERALTQGSWLARLYPAHWLGRARMKRFLREQGQSCETTDISRLLAACMLEQRWRMPRETLAGVFRTLLQTAVSADSTSAMHAQQAADSLRQLIETREAAGRLSAAPEPTRADTAAGRGDMAIEHWLSEVEAALHRHAAIQRSLHGLETLVPWMEADFVAQLDAAIRQNQGTALLRGPLTEELPTLLPYQQFRTRAGRLEEADFALLSQLRALQPTLDAVAPDTLEAYVRRLINREARLAWKSALEQKQPELLLEVHELTSRVRQLAETDAAMRQANRRHLIGSIDRSQLGTQRNWEDITRLRGARTRRLREFIAEGIPIGLMQLKPVWLMNPDVASRVLPLSSGLFDVVIYDEASQMPVEYALPTLYRGKLAVVSGDEKQMPPTAFFASKTALDDGDDGDDDLDGLDEEARRDAEEEKWNQREINECPDLLQLARGSLPGSTLQIHYRSRYRELIGYSNAAFYRNDLHVPVRHPPANVLAAQPLEWHQIDGVYRQQTNEDEAHAVVDWLSGIWRQPFARRPSVGVVTFNRKQADLIEDLMEERAEADDAFRQAWSEERERQQDGEDMGVFVKNVENVQGDERDIIVFSTTFGRDPRGVFRRNFGVLGQTGGERRLNVAVTRSRNKMVVMSSMPVADVGDFLTTRRQPGSPRDHLQAWLSYARMVSAGEFDAVDALVGRLHRKEIGRGDDIKRDKDGFIRSVAEFIRRLGHVPHAVAQQDAFALDFAIENPAGEGYALGIECDSPQHPLLRHARAREIWRPSMLTQTIPHLHRISALHWYRDRQAAQSALRQAIEHSLGASQP